jgi:transposase
MKHPTVGVDIAKSVMQIHYIDAETGEIVNKPLKRGAFLEHFANRSPCLIGMEACGGSPHWARRLTAMGHQVKLMPAKFVKAFVMGNKNVEQDHRAIKRIIKPMMGFKDFRCARIILAGIELMHMIRKGQMHDDGFAKTAAEQFYSLVI